LNNFIFNENLFKEYIINNNNELYNLIVIIFLSSSNKILNDEEEDNINERILENINKDEEQIESKDINEEKKTFLIKNFQKNSYLNELDNNWLFSSIERNFLNKLEDNKNENEIVSNLRFITFLEKNEYISKNFYSNENIPLIIKIANYFKLFLMSPDLFLEKSVGYYLFEFIFIYFTKYESIEYSEFFDHEKINTNEEISKMIVENDNESKFFKMFEELVLHYQNNSFGNKIYSLYLLMFFQNKQWKPKYRKFILNELKINSFRYLNFSYLFEKFEMKNLNYEYYNDLMNENTEIVNISKLNEENMKNNFLYPSENDTDILNIYLDFLQNENVEYYKTNYHYFYSFVIHHLSNFIFNNYSSFTNLSLFKRLFLLDDLIFYDLFNYNFILGVDLNSFLNPTQVSFEKNVIFNYFIQNLNLENFDFKKF
jgi:hypothetical protein